MEQKKSFINSNLFTYGFILLRILIVYAVVNSSINGTGTGLALTIAGVVCILIGVTGGKLYRLFVG